MQTTPSPLLGLVDITRSFPGVVALDRVSLALAAGEVHAIVGENGAGKSTLINVIAGLLTPDGGTMKYDGQEVFWTSPVEARRRGVVPVHQEAELFPTLSVAENMALEQGLRAGPLGWVRWREVYDQAARAVALLGEPIDVRQEAARLGVGQRHMAQIAAAVVTRARVLVLDEPTSALTARETDWLFEQIARLKSAGVGIIYVSHRLEEIFRLADRITVLRDGQRVWQGPRGSIDRQELVRQMVGRGATPARARLATVAPNERSPRLEVKNLSAVNGRFRDISLTVRAGEVLGIYGLVGSGRSEFARAVFGLEKPASGTIAIDGQRRSIASPAQAVAAGLAYLPEDRLRQGIFRGLSVRANTVLSALRVAPWASASVECAATRTQVESLGIRCRGVEQPVGQLSGGNQQKVVIARWLLTRPAVLILDEPTRGVDIGAKDEIHRIVRRLADEGTAVAMISSDLSEVMENSDRILVFREGRVACELAPQAATPEAVTAAALPDTPAGGAESSSARSRARTSASPSRRGPLRRWSSETSLGAAIVVLLLALGLSTDAFLTSSNLWGLLSSASVNTILALGAATIIMAGGIVMKLPYSAAVTVPAGIATAIAVGIALGLVNAGLTLAGGVHPIVVTLGTLTIYRGLLVSLTGGDNITDLPRVFTDLSTGRWLGVNGIVLLTIAIAVAAHVFIAHSQWGRHLLAFGSSPSAARLVGISQRRAWLMAFGIGGLLAALAGLVEFAQTGALQTPMGTGYELQAIAAALIGGVSISGGRGSMLGVCLGALLLSLVYNAVVLWQVSGYHYALVTGLLLLVAILADRFAQRSTP